MHVKTRHFITLFPLFRNPSELLFDLLNIMFQEVLGWLCKDISGLACGYVHVKAHCLTLSHPSLLGQAHAASDEFFYGGFARAGEKQGSRVAIQSM